MTDYSVLLVEDDPFNRDILHEILDEIDCCAVVEKTNGAEALAWLNANPAPHVILLDMMMPEMDGYQLLDHLRATGRLDGIRVIGISARAHVHDQEKALSAGCWRYLTKPFNIIEVEQAVRDALEE
jgi:CheY-like chemotaxis protein